MKNTTKGIKNEADERCLGSFGLYCQVGQIESMVAVDKPRYCNLGIGEIIWEHLCDYLVAIVQ